MTNLIQDSLLEGITTDSQVWMSHSDTITQLPAGFELLASTNSIEVAAYKKKNAPVYGLQFHPEVTHSLDGKKSAGKLCVTHCQM